MISITVNPMAIPHQGEELENSSLDTDRRSNEYDSRFFGIEVEMGQVRELLPDLLQQPAVGGGQELHHAAVRNGDGHRDLAELVGPRPPSGIPFPPPPAAVRIPAAASAAAAVFVFSHGVGSALAG